MKKFKKIYIEITNVCNMNCSFCIKTKRAKQFMNVEEFEKILKKIEGYTNLITLHVKGEPLIHPQLDIILSLCEKYNLVVNITTNGTLLKENINTIIDSKAIRQINISIHSIEQNNNLNEKEYLENIFTSVKQITSKTNIIISYRLWNLKSIVENDKNSSIIKSLENEYNYNDLLNQSKIHESVKLENNIFLNQDKIFKWPSMKENVISETGTCQGLRNQIAILVDGTVVPCCLDQDGDINLGNIFYETMEDILNKEKVKKIKQGFENNILEEELCKKCDFRTKFN